MRCVRRAPGPLTRACCLRRPAPQGKVATRSAPPSVGFGAYVAVAVAASYAAVVYSTGDLNPAGARLAPRAMTPCRAAEPACC